jgi:hypothetical protein
LAEIRPNFHNNQIQIFLFVFYWLEYDQIVITIKFVHFWKKRIANFNHFLKNPLCEVILPNVHVNGKRFRSTNFERPEESYGPIDRAEALYFALNTLNL